MNLIIILILAILATYRLAQLIAFDDGPFDLIARFREFLGRNAYRGLWVKTLADMINCPFCLGIWISLFITLSIRQYSSFLEFFLQWIGIAGGQAFLQELTLHKSTTL